MLVLRLSQQRRHGYRNLPTERLLRSCVYTTYNTPLPWELRWGYLLVPVLYQRSVCSLSYRVTEKYATVSTLCTVGATLLLLLLLLLQNSAASAVAAAVMFTTRLCPTQRTTLCGTSRADPVNTSIFHKSRHFLINKMLQYIYYVEGGPYAEYVHKQ